MNIDDDDTDDAGDTGDTGDNGNGNGYAESAVDPHTRGLMIAVTWCRVANNKTLERTIKKLDRLNRRYADTQAKLAAVQAQAAELVAKMESDASALAERERAQTERDDAFAVSAQDVRDELREHHAYLNDLHRLLVHRVAATAGIIWNETLQEPPSWQQLRQQIPDLPPDPAPAAEAAVRIDTFSDTSDDPHADRHGHVFLNTLTRSTEHKRAQT
jgi:hypothetical protein